MNRPTWKQLLDEGGPLLLPAAYDALTARLVEQSGFRALQVGGFALAASGWAVPDVGLTCFGEERVLVERIVGATALPVMVDADDGYGDAKNVTRMVRDYERLGVAAVFLEDQGSPKRCGHLGGKKVLPRETMAAKVRAACAARRSDDFFVLARTDALGVEGMDAALDRARAYRDAGADGLYVEATHDRAEMERVARALEGTPLAVSLMTGDDQNEWVPPAELAEMGYAMVLYSTSVLFAAVRATLRALRDLRDGRPVADPVTLPEFEDLIGLRDWVGIEERFPTD